MNKVYGGTPNHSTESRCLTCRNAHHLRGIADSSERTFCRSFGKDTPLKQPVTECSLYDDKRQASRWDMEQIAWVLLTKRTGQAIGFVSAEDFRKTRQDQDQAASPAKVGF